ncbi:MAG: alpha/beta hydrolase [Xanthomonadales bacterium]|nr:alpha/beta hydrolase [Xanthomonadales bacterium]
MKIYFAHGKERGPWGSKIKRLAGIAESLGCMAESIDYTDLRDSADLRVERLVNVLNNEAGPFILVGSSMGGYVSLVASGQVEAQAVFLLAPALYMGDDYQSKNYPHKSRHIEIVHGWSDDIIPPENSIRFAKEADCTLHLISGDHVLHSSIETVEVLFEQFLKKVLAG